MYRVKQLFADLLMLRDYGAQVAEALAMVRALNKMTKVGMPKVYLLHEQWPVTGRVASNLIYSTKPRGRFLLVGITDIFYQLRKAEIIMQSIFTDIEM